jgi:hypothetical protein
MPDASQPAAGIHCPRCHCRDLRDESGRPAGLSRTRDAWAVTKVEAKRGYIRRRRTCRNCGHVVFTREQIETHNPYKVRP